MPSHHNLRAFQAARASFLAIQRWSEPHWSPPRASLHNQLRRAALSVVLNLAEGHASGRGGRGRYLYGVAFGSSVETVEILSVCGELGEDVATLEADARVVRAMCYCLWERTTE
jgi:four helix bundle protein